jgi:uncharacterized protein YdcH (DUF465 family)
MTVFLFLLIVYGITLIIVQGTIFDRPRILLSKLIDKINTQLYPNEAEVFDLIEKNDKAIDPKLIEMFNSLTKSIQVMNADTKNFNDAVSVLNNTRLKIKNQIWQSRSNIFLRFFDKTLNFFQTLISCMMCTSFWVAVFIILVTLFVDISIFGLSITVITVANPLATAISGFFLACLASGTTWIIHVIVDTIYSYKQ